MYWTAPTGTYAGGAFVANIPRDLTHYDAVTFWAKASMPATLDLVGLGNDNAGTSQYVAQIPALPLSTSWRKFVSPIPLASRLIQGRGLFFFAEGPENGVGDVLWLDDIRFETVSTIKEDFPLLQGIVKSLSMAVHTSFVDHLL